MTSFTEQITHTLKTNHSLLCVGLDPDVSRIPADFQADAPDVARIRAFCLNIIEQTHDLVCCYKPNAAFFEQFGPEGMAALREVIAACHAVNIPVLLDAKRGDIGNTAKAYARAAFEVWNADAITISPYLGRDSVAPFLAYAGKSVFLLCHTSNPSAAEVQHHGSPALFAHIAEAAQTWGTAAQIGFVVGATQIAALDTVRRLAPAHWILAPGIGAQGGNLADALRAGLNAEGGGVIVPVSRGVLYAENPRAAAQHLRDAINQQREAILNAAAESKPRPDKPSVDLILKLYAADCIKFGEFTLASGQTSPIYVDLRRVMSYPTLFQQVVQAYAALARTLDYDRIAAVPYAALPVAGALALQLKQPLIYPRKQAKAHGTRQTVEGAFEPGQTAVAIEDVITSGGSLLKAIATLEAAGIHIHDVIVLVNREQGGQARLAAQGHQLHTVLTIGQILTTLRDEDRISTTTFEEVQAYLAG